MRENVGGKGSRWRIPQECAGVGAAACCAASAQRVAHGCKCAHRHARVVLAVVFCNRVVVSGESSLPPLVGGRGVLQTCKHARFQRGVYGDIVFLLKLIAVSSPQPTPSTAQIHKPSRLILYHLHASSFTPPVVDPCTLVLHAVCRQEPSSSVFLVPAPIFCKLLLAACKPESAATVLHSILPLAVVLRTILPSEGAI
jgi:hypothetical protein